MQRTAIPHLSRPAAEEPACHIAARHGLHSSGNITHNLRLGMQEVGSKRVVQEDTQSTRENAEARYSGYRDAVYHHVYENWTPVVKSLGVDLRLFPIDENALQHAEETWAAIKVPGRPEPFRWRDILKSERRTPRRFEMAVWNGSLLCGLTIGKASRSMNGSDSNVTITFLQGAPAPINKLRGYIAPIAIDAAEAYARILGRPMVFIKDPLPEVRSYYEKFDFTVAKRRCKGLYLGKKSED